MRTDFLNAEALALELADAMPKLDEQKQRVAIALFRLLAEGEPVAVKRLVERTGLSLDETQALLESWPGVYFDDARVVGFWGLALAHMPHRLNVEGRELRAWCAWDTLFLPELIGKPAKVESRCPATGETITLRVVPGEGVVDLSPSTAVVSFLRPGRPFDADVIISFCHFVHFFRDEAAAGDWTARHEHTFWLSIDEGFEIGRIGNQVKFGAGLSALDHK